jgi:U6 snRNA-associated Sm-like protein LSm6
MENGAATEGKDPSTFLGEITGAPVTVKLNSGVVYQGMTRYRSQHNLLLT